MLLVTGASGFLGASVVSAAAAAGRAVTGTVHRNSLEHYAVRTICADLTDASTVRELLGDLKPDCVINCVAFTSVDGCESDAGHARMLNVEVPRLLAAACSEAGARFAHISTDSVFDGTRGFYTEDDVPAPVNVYAQTKLAGEQAALAGLPRALVLRTNFIGISPGRRTGLADWLHGRFQAGERIAGFTDVVFSPLLADNVARTALEMLDLDLHGLYHLAAHDSISKYDFACRLGGALGHDTSLVDRATLASAKLAAPRPLDTSLSPARAEAALGRKMETVGSAVTGYAAQVTALMGA